jgi:hypothetical protein
MEAQAATELTAAQTMLAAAQAAVPCKFYLCSRALSVLM